MIRYDPLWETMKKRGVSQYKLLKDYHFSARQLSRLRKKMRMSVPIRLTLSAKFWTVPLKKSPFICRTNRTVKNVPTDFAKTSALSRQFPEKYNFFLKYA